MIVDANVTVDGSKAQTWRVMTDIENAAQTMSGIEAIEILERPTTGLLGMRWRETRLLFGKPATVEKRVTRVEEGSSYTTSTDSDGFVFEATTSVGETDGHVTLASSHATLPRTFGAKVRALPMVLFKGMIRRAILQDLNDIKAVVEKR